MQEPIVLHESADFLILDKPAGWVVNDAATAKGNPIVQNWLKENFDYEIAEDPGLRGGIVHRLDKETSGVLLVAKTKEAFSYYQMLFKERRIKKTYLALAHGKIDPPDGYVDAPVGRLPWRRDRFGVLAGGRQSRTAYKVLGYYKKDASDYSFVELSPKTGRTHQIRIHLKYLRHPIVSDEFYAGRRTSRDDRKWCPRLFLHAFSLAFIPDSQKEEVRFVSPLPPDLQASFDKLEHIN